MGVWEEAAHRPHLVLDTNLNNGRVLGQPPAEILNPEAPQDRNSRVEVTSDVAAQKCRTMLDEATKVRDAQIQ